MEPEDGIKTVMMKPTGEIYSARLGQTNPDHFTSPMASILEIWFRDGKIAAIFPVKGIAQYSKVDFKVMVRSFLEELQVRGGSIDDVGIGRSIHLVYSDAETRLIFNLNQI